LKIVIQTVYENVDKKWLKWWLKNSGMIKENPGVAEALSNGENYVFQSKDPTSKVTGTTTYTILP